MSINPVRSRDGAEAMVLYGNMITRHSLVYGLGIASVIPLSLVSLAVTTRYLDPSDYGRLATLFAISAVLTVLGTAGLLQGMTILVFREADDGEGGDVLQIEGADGPEETLAEKKRLLGSGLLTCAFAGLFVCSLPFVLAPAAANLIFGSPDWASSVRWMAASAWAGSTWRPIQQVYRLERRPKAWAMLNLFRPVAVVVGTLAALMLGWGIDGVLIATAAGTVATILIGLFGIRRLMTFRPRQRDPAKIWRAGLRVLPIVLARIVQTNLGVLVVAATTTPETVGLYQVAAKVAQMPTFFGNGFLMAWTPLERSPVSAAARDRKGPQEYQAAVFTLFFLTLVGLVVSTAVLSPDLIGVAAPAYKNAAPLIPVLSAALMSYLVFTGIYRATSFANRILWYTALHFFWLVPFGAVAVLLTPVPTSYRVALAELCAGLTVTLLLAARDRRGPYPTPIPWRRLLTAVVIGAACAGTVVLVEAPAQVHLLLVVAVMSLFPVLVVRGGVISLRQLTLVRAILSALTARPLSHRKVQERIKSLKAVERDALSKLVWEKRGLPEVADALALDPRVLQARLTRALLAFSGVFRASPSDQALGDYVLRTQSALERDELATHLRSSGVDALDLHELDEAMRVAQRATRRALRALSERPASGS